ncbi:hypothetical protein K144313037_14550 [Clostridium tetani]|uniref:hypothetical protein n=1 Tax=Clostridium tetani TaxID=1513 RepID=UPI000D21EC7E|nr:hypothetical protein [Clostridium tetani]AVP54181.1 hypothetical protein C3B72_03235 [Clostridium tetani]RXI51047.1 hypothetical protein DP122_12400 [Clostridium tetani]RXI51093.1 hypothetical protein DP124_10500 [Clostridium tetani]RXI76294.1 hypothetical protein DP128_07155 [Clostridium tetani]RXM57120.1 hypothetical protein DP133_11140 [Clostridium tetani]
MGFTDKLNKYYAENYIKKYGDRLSQVQGNIVSVKVEEKTILWIFHKITAVLLVKPERSKNIVRCVYKKKRWFKKIDFIPLSQGNFVLVQGLKGKKGKENREEIEIMNIRNLTTKRDLIPLEEEPKVQRVKQTKYK